MAEVAQNKSNDDAKASSFLSNTNVQVQGNLNVGTPSITDGSTISNSGTTVAGKEGHSNNITNATGNKSPIARPNPLGYFSTYTYQLSLYMITPEALNTFRQNNRKNIKQLTTKPGGAVLIMQSGGINNKSNTRPKEFEYDYYMDNLQLISLISPNDNFISTVATRISFQIIEPYGFSFLSRLKQAGINLMKDSSTPNIKSLENVTRHTFVLGIGFQGYDEYGNPFTGKEVLSNGEVLDANGSSDGLFQVYYDIRIKSIKFKIDGKATIYNIDAVSLATENQSVKNSTIPTAVTVEAERVIDALEGDSGLLTLINNYWLCQNVDIPPTYKVKFIGDFDDLKYASIEVPSDNTKFKWPIKRDPNDPSGAKAINNSSKRMISFSKTSIMAAMEKIFVQSTFMYNAFKVNPNNEPAPDEKTKNYDEQKPPNPTPFRWFNITTELKTLGFCQKQNSFVYETTYVIVPYDTPTVLSNMPKILPKYYGPHKRYDYWYTGKNTEVISYEQQNNNGYYLTVFDSNIPIDPGIKSAGIPITPALQANGDTTGTFTAGGQGTASITSNLYDPKSYANAKISILGDPDFLVHDDLNYQLPSYAFDKFYAPNGRTINPTGGHVYIEVDFKEGVDYVLGSGLMNINESITFWQYPDSIKALVHGVSFQVKKINNTFRGGKFTQELEMFINLLSEKSFDLKGSIEAREQQEAATKARQGTGSTNVAGDATSTTTGLRPVPAPSEGPTPNQEQSNQSPDDSGTTNSNTQSTEEQDSGREQ